MLVITRYGSPRFMTGFFLLIVGALSTIGTTSRLQAQDVSLGYHHNEALRWFAATEAPLAINPDQTLSLVEYRRILRSTLTYADMAYKAGVNVEQYVELYVGYAHDLGLVDEDSQYGPSLVLDNQQSYTAQILYLRGERAISKRLAEELFALHAAAEKAVDGEAYRTMVLERLSGQRWSRNDQEVVDKYVEVFKASSVYWQQEDETRDIARRKPWWVVAGADALGAIGGAVVGTLGFGPVGGVVGAVGAGAAFSGIASSW